MGSIYRQCFSFIRKIQHIGKSSKSKKSSKLNILKISYYQNLNIINQNQSAYAVGDTISIEHQLNEYDICYGAEEHGFGEGDHGAVTLSLGDFNGFINETGIFYVTFIDMAASW